MCEGGRTGRPQGRSATMPDRWQQRADDAMATLARERGKALTGYAFLLTGDLRDAEDLVQDALVKTFVRRRYPSM